MNLEVLRLPAWVVSTDAELALLKGLTKLKTMSMRDTKITDAGLEQMKGFSKLEELDLQECLQITDAGLVHLHGLTELKQIDLRGTHVMRVTAVGQRRLQRALPELAVRPNGASSL
jgi:hypothetical protein